MKIKHILEYGLMRAFLLPLGVLPLFAINLFAGALACLLWLFCPVRSSIVYTNLTRVFPEMSRAERMGIFKQLVHELAQAACKTFILYRRSLFQAVEQAKIQGQAELDQALAQGKGVILTTCHGTWLEAYLAWLNSNGYPATLIYQQQSNPLSNRFFRRQRMRYGTCLEQLPSKSGMKRFEQALAENRILIVCIDQSYRRRGADVDFFGHTMRCAKGTAVLHMRTGAPVLNSFYQMEAGRLHIDIEPLQLRHYDEITEQAIVEISTTALQWYEPYIRNCPEQWFGFLHRLWDKKSYPKKFSRSIAEIFLTK